MGHARSRRQHYHVAAADVTGIEGAGGSLTVNVWPDGRETLSFTDDWPRLAAPAPEGESVAAYRDRVIVGDPFVQTVLTWGATIRNRLKFPSLDGMRPADRTVEWWRKTWPYKEFYSSYGETRREALAYHLSRIVWRLVVELFDRLRAGDLVAEGRRIDVANGQAAVSADLYGNPDMVLRPSFGAFRRERRPGQPAPGSLPSFIELTLWPAKPAKTKRRKLKPDLLADALVSLHRKGVINVHSRAVSVDELHTLAKTEAGIKGSSKATFERALTTARKHVPDS